MRWEEEEDLTMHEMVWSTAYFLQQAMRWGQWRDQTRMAAAAAGSSAGNAAYAEKQINKWQMLAANADAHYVKLVPHYSKLI